MPRKVVIHAGFHKTGSNTVQQTLRLNRPVLRRVMASVLKPMMGDVVGAARTYSVTGDPLERARFAARMVLLLQDQPVFRNVHDVCADDAGDLYGCQWNADQAYPYKLRRV